VGHLTHHQVFAEDFFCLSRGSAYFLQQLHPMTEKRQASRVDIPAQKLLTSTGTAAFLVF